MPYISLQTHLTPHHSGHHILYILEKLDALASRLPLACWRQLLGFVGPHIWPLYLTARLALFGVVRWSMGWLNLAHLSMWNMNMRTEVHTASMVLPLKYVRSHGRSFGCHHVADH